METFLLFSRRWCYSTSFGVLNATRFHFPHLPERQRHCHCCHHSHPSTLQGPLWGVESPRRLPPFPLPPNLSLSYWGGCCVPCSGGFHLHRFSLSHECRVLHSPDYLLPDGSKWQRQAHDFLGSSASSEVLTTHFQMHCWVDLPGVLCSHFCGVMDGRCVVKMTHASTMLKSLPGKTFL